MSILREYEVIKNAIRGSEQNSSIIEDSMCLIVDIMESWLDSYEYTKDFDALMHAIKEDYSYGGTIYRGITLLKSSEDLNDRVSFSKIQSFSKEKEVAVNFATNNLVTEGEEINMTKNPEDIISVIIEFTGKNIGIDLDKFAGDLIYVCKNSIKNKKNARDFEELLSYAIEEREVLVYPRILSENNKNITLYTI